MGFNYKSMKFVLLIYICSVVGNTCMPPIQDPIEYESWYDCSVNGYKKSLDIIEEMSTDQVNNHKIYAKFYCRSGLTT